MPDPAPVARPAPRAWPRRLLHLSGPVPGPLLVTVGGLAGDDPSGLLAAERVAGPPGFSLAAGDWIALAGNRQALARGLRGVDRDLARGWTDDALARLECSAPEARDTAAEDDEQRGLWAALLAARAAARGPAHVLVLGAAPPGGPARALAGGDEPGRAFAARFGLPLAQAPADGLVSHLARQGASAAALELGPAPGGAADPVAAAAGAIARALAALGLAPAGGEAPGAPGA